jgi:ATP-binding cassette subfamily B protein
MDEPTSALDIHTETALIHQLENVDAAARVIVAHRLSTVMHADEILVMRRGQIVERGSHRVLLENKGLYADMFLQQQSHQINEY